MAWKILLKALADPANTKTFTPVLLMIEKDSLTVFFAKLLILQRFFSNLHETIMGDPKTCTRGEFIQCIIRVMVVYMGRKKIAPKRQNSCQLLSRESMGAEN